MNERNDTQRDEEPTPEDGDVGAPDESPAADQPPGLPADDDSALGDTDQHSDA